MKSANPRWIALQVMLQVLDSGRSLDDIFRGDWYQNLPASRRDLGLSREISFGLCRWYFALCTVLAPRLKKSLRRRDRDIELAMLIGLYQLLIMQTGSHAAVDEAVKLARSQNKQWAAGLVNAVLRGVVRDRLSLDADAHRDACPGWMLARIEADWGGQAEAITAALCGRPPMTLRVDICQVEREAYIDELDGIGIAASMHPLVPDAILLDSATDPGRLPGFEQGRVSVQDASAQLAARLLPLQPGARVLDACAAPGGKTLHLSQRYPGIEVDALDSSEARLPRLRQNLDRGGVGARVLVGDARAPASLVRRAPLRCDSRRCALFRQRRVAAPSRH